MAAPANLDKPSRELPRPVGQLIGRSREIADLRAMIEVEGVRLLTLTGPGGVGKTRLALAVASSVAKHLQAEAYFVPLASVNDPNLVAPAIARQLGLRAIDDQPLIERIAARLRQGHMLLVLDNFEHVVEAAPLVTQLLSTCPHLSVLVTSRVRLRLSGEVEYAVGPLALPDEEVLTDVDRVAATGAVRLFTERARAARTDFALTAENVPAVAEVCRRLDGLPLAIELAAAWVKVLSPQALLDRLGRRLPLLTGGGRDLPARHQTMRDAIAWSFDLLDEPERVLFRRLAVFTGGFTLEAAEAVCSGAEGDPSPPLDVLRGVASLVDKSLLSTASRQSDETRFEMLETIREYGLDQLGSQAEEWAIRSAHATFFLALAERHERAGWVRFEPSLPLRFDAEMPNLRAALSWMDTTGNAEDMQAMAGALRWFWSARGYVPEGRLWLERSLGHAKPTSLPVRARALLAFAQFSYFQGDEPLARRLFADGLSLYREAGDPLGQAFATSALGALAIYREEYDAAVPLLDRALALTEGTDDPEVAASMASAATSSKAVTAFRLGDLPLAATLADRALERYRALSYVPGVTSNLLLSATIARAREDYASALDRYQQGLALAHAGSDPRRILELLDGIAWIAVSTGQAELAARLFAAAGLLRERTGFQVAARLEPMSTGPGVDAARTALGDTDFEAAWATGRAMPLDTAIDLALRLELPTNELPSSAAASALADGRLVLTPREQEILPLLAAGKSDAEIAAALFLSVRTVESHLHRLTTKLGVRGRTAVVEAVRAAGLLSPPAGQE